MKRERTLNEYNLAGRCPALYGGDMERGTKSYHHGNTVLYPVYERLCWELAPESGPCGTVEGVRAFIVHGEPGFSQAELDRYNALADLVVRHVESKV